MRTSRVAKYAIIGSWSDLLVTVSSVHVEGLIAADLVDLVSSSVVGAARTMRCMTLPLTASKLRFGVEVSSTMLQGLVRVCTTLLTDLLASYQGMH